jgi:hypothetical protein
MKSYLLFYNSVVGTREEIVNVLNRMLTVISWRYDMENCFYLTSNNSAREIVSEFEGIRGKSGRYIVLEYNGNAQGRLTIESWYLLNNKKHKPK